MKENISYIEKMPFFDSFYNGDKAVININAFEKWVRDILNTEEVSAYYTTEQINKALADPEV
jgi:hypothetical protein